MQGIEDQMGSLVELFLEECPLMMTAIREAVKNQDADHTLQRAAHTLKGSADNFGAERVVTAAWQLEQFAIAGDLGKSSESLAKLEQELEALKQALHQQCAMPSETAEPQVD
jgi:HPt (histidine-containing phosphotransfer) domain-containing protein